MKKLLTFFLCGLLLILSRGASAQDKDFQLWTELKLSYTVPKTPWTIQWATENRFSENVTDYKLFNTTIGFDYKVKKWFKSGFYYRFEKDEAKPRENRLFPQLELAMFLGPFEVSTRQRFEIRIFPDEVRFRYRPRFKVALPIKTSPVSLKPFVSDEFMVEPGNGDLDQNRFAVGNSFGFLKDKINFDLYYMLRRDKGKGGAPWTSTDILGTSLGFKF